MRQTANNEKKMFSFSQHDGNTFSKTTRPHQSVANSCLCPPTHTQMRSQACARFSEGSIQLRRSLGKVFGRERRTLENLPPAQLLDAETVSLRSSGKLK